MDMRRINLGLLGVLLVALSGGCQKSEPESSNPGGTPEAPGAAAVAERVARIHWLGKKRLAMETNAAYFMSIWNLAESSRLEAQTLDKLSVAPWRLWKGEAAVTNAPRALLRPLIEDLVQQEAYFEVNHVTNQPGEFALAIRLTDERSSLWQTNLAAALESLTGLRAAPSLDGRAGWSLKKQDPPNLIALSRVGEWTLVSAGHNTNALLRDMAARIERDGAPFGPQTTNYWLEADFDLRRVSDALALGWRLPKAWPQISLAVIGDGENVRTRGELTFAEPLPLELEPWNIPTNLVHDPLVSFSAIRGIAPWVASLSTWTELQMGSPPNQIFSWAQQGAPMKTYFSAPFADASNRLHRATPIIMQHGTAWLATNGVGKLEPVRERAGVAWSGGPFVSFRLESAATLGGEFVFGGFLSNVATNLPVPAALLEEVYTPTNLLYYDWEITQARLDAWIFMGQAFRLAFRKAQLPKDSASIAWFKAAAHKLGNAVTVANRIDPQHISFVRRSSAGMTAAELHLLADWLESPQFPKGVHTLLATPDVALNRTSPIPPPPVKR
ncbi:MAG: hypothetical protein IH623_22290 [Verrucomicrobia bacterium]|nr:hypothetical protein [Verrucomicrobiota bacterium]